MSENGGATAAVFPPTPTFWGPIAGPPSATFFSFVPGEATELRASASPDTDGAVAGLQRALARASLATPPDNRSPQYSDDGDDDSAAPAPTASIGGNRFPRAAAEPAWKKCARREKARRAQAAGAGKLRGDGRPPLAPRRERNVHVTFVADNAVAPGSPSLRVPPLQGTACRNATPRRLGCEIGEGLALRAALRTPDGR